MLNYYAENYHHSLISKPLCNGISLMAYQKLSKTQPQENTRTLKKTSILCHVHEIRQVQRKGQISNEEENKHKTGI